MSEFVKVANINEFGGDDIKKTVVKGREIAIYRHNGSYYATSSICPHQGGPLDEGTLQDGQVVCPWHGWLFNVKDGSCQFNPSVKIESYETKVEGDDIYLKV